MPDEKNPYPPGSARAKLWERREAERRKAAPPEKKDEVEEEIEKREGLGYFKRKREAQSTDGNN